MSLRRIDQTMAARAAQILEGEVNEQLRTRMRQLPGRLRGSGLAATYAFLMARAAKDDAVARAYERLTLAIAAYTDERRLLADKPLDLTPEKFLRYLAGASADRYARVAAEIDILAVWLSRLATALYRARKIEGGAGPGPGPEGEAGPGNAETSGNAESPGNAAEQGDSDATGAGEGDRHGRA